MISGHTLLRRRRLTHTTSRKPGRRDGESGFVLLFVVFLAAVMLIGMSAGALRLNTAGRRAKEDETVWRGEQYVRAVRLYYRKYGRFPRSVDDFSKNPGNVHFLRKTYTDPMNSKDGTWRFIYVGPTGQLIGSVTRKNPIGTIPLPGQAANPFGAPGQGTAPRTGQNIFGGGAPGAGTQGATAQGTPSGQPQPGSQPASAGQESQEPGTEEVPPPPNAPNQAIEGASTAEGTVFGASIIGVGSKVDRRSIRFYNGYGRYREWEFIWDPMADMGPGGAQAQPGVPGQQPIAPATPQGATPPQ
jgi:hypothetical protein